MRINSQNIEQWIFDCHEEMLSETEKTELLDFLHANPEYNAEFGLWAQTHALKNEEIHVPADLLDGVIQTTPTPFYNTKFVLGTLTGIALSAIVTSYYFLSLGSNETTKPTINESVKAKKILREEKRESAAKPKTTKEVQFEFRTVNKKVLIDESSSKATFKNAMSDSVIQLKEELPKLEQTVKLDKTQLQDTIAKPVEIIEQKELKNDEQEKVTEIRKKKRSLLPFSVKPQSKFKPANPDF
jgi:hypothetical protein